MKCVALLRKENFAVLLLFFSSITNAELIDKSVNTGYVASFGGYYANGLLFGSVRLHGSGDSKTTFLQYYVTTPGGGFKAWKGNVPNSALTGAATGIVKLNFDTCNIDSSTSCGLVNITWKPDLSLTTHFSGLTRETYGNIKIHKHGSSIYNYAEANGSILGNEITIAFYNMSYTATEHSVTTTISRVVQ